MTGELTLTGRVLPAGGICEKVIAPKRNALKTALLPAANRGDFEKLPAIEIRHQRKLFGDQGPLQVKTTTTAGIR